MVKFTHISNYSDLIGFTIFKCGSGYGKMIPDSQRLSGIIAYMAVGERGANADPVPAAGQIRFPLAIPIRVPRTILFLFQLPVTIRFSPPVAVRLSGSVAVRPSGPGRAAG